MLNIHYYARIMQFIRTNISVALPTPRPNNGTKPIQFTELTDTHTYLFPVGIVPTRRLFDMAYGSFRNHFSDAAFSFN